MERSERDNVAEFDDYRIPVNHARTLSNCLVHEYKDGNKVKEIRMGKTASVIANEMFGITDGWPKRYSNRLFVVIGGQIVGIDTTSSLFGWLSGLGITYDWNNKAVGSINKDEFFNHVMNVAEKFSIVSEIPQHPIQDNTFYLDRPLPAPTGAIDRLIDMFKPSSDADRAYIKAMICTPFWGGPCGSRPAFVIDGPEDDSEGGRGVGKTTLSKALTWIVGKSIDLDPGSRWDDMTKRLLGASDERLVRWDNIKSMKLSSGSIEQLLTAEFISGHKMFKGQTTMPNNFTFIMTFNGASLSKDLSQRVILIRLERPAYQASWEDNLRLFINVNRFEIIADAMATLKAETPQGFTTHTRFAMWERDVLSKCSADTKISETARTRQQGVDDDSDMAQDVHETLHSRLVDMDQYSRIGMIMGKADPSKHVYLLSKKFVTGVIQDVMGNGRVTTRHASKIFKRINLPQILGEVIKDGLVYYVYSNNALVISDEKLSGVDAVLVKSYTDKKLEQWNKFT